MNLSATQRLIFQHLKSQLPPHKALVDEIADLLGISNDSAYRRIRGEKLIGLAELQKISIRFNVSVDHLLNLHSDTLLFTGKPGPYHTNTIEGGLADVLSQLEFLTSFRERHVYCLVKDVPLFYHFQIPELADFKLFFWMKSILHYDSLKGVRFQFGNPARGECLATCQRIAALYQQLPTTEIWTIESLNSSLRQIEFYQEAGFFANAGDAARLYEKLGELVDALEYQAELGVKCMVRQPPSGPSTHYQLFVNEFIMGDNAFLAELDGSRITFLNHSVLYFVGTRDEAFNNFTFDALHNLLQKSTLISGVGEKERSRFFNTLRLGIHQRAQQSRAA